MASTTILQPLSIKHGQGLPTSSSPFAASSVTIREGASATTLNLRTILNQISNFTLTTWGDLNPDVATIVVTKQYSTDSGATWLTLGTTEVQGLVDSELDISTTTAVSAGMVSVSVDDDAIDSNIDHDGTTRVRLNILITDDDGGTMRIYQPLSITHGISLPTGSHTESSATTLREGATAMTLNLQEIINNINNVELTDWDDLNPQPTAISPEIEYSTNSGSSWSVLGTTAVRGLVSSEVTFVTTSALSAGTMTIALDDDAVTQNTLHDSTTRFRAKILLTEGTRQLFIYIPLDVRHGYALPAQTSTLSTLEIREGATESINLLDALNGITGFDADAWSDINPVPDSITVTPQYTEDAGVTWTTLGAIAFEDLIGGDFSYNAADAVSDGMFEVTLDDATIISDVPYTGDNRIRLRIVIDDGE